MSGKREALMEAILEPPVDQGDSMLLYECVWFRKALIWRVAMHNITHGWWVTTFEGKDFHEATQSWQHLVGEQVR